MLLTAVLKAFIIVTMDDGLPSNSGMDLDLSKSVITGSTRSVASEGKRVVCAVGYVVKVTLFYFDDIGRCAPRRRAYINFLILGTHIFKLYPALKSVSVRDFLKESRKAHPDDVQTEILILRKIHFYFYRTYSQFPPAREGFSRALLPSVIF